MERNEVVSLFKLIKDVYPTFEVSTQKINTWAHLMKDMDYKRVMAKANEHVQSNKFPPTIAEISAFAPRENNHLDKMEQWEQEARRVPVEVKRRFAQELKHLIREKSQ